MLASAAIAFSLGFLQSPSRLLPRRAVTTAASTVMCTTLSDAQLAQYLVRTTLMELPGWEDGGKGIARPALAELIDEWDEDESEEFEEAIEALEEADWLHTGNDGRVYSGSNVHIRRMYSGIRRLLKKFISS